jgi:hypothetical protein
MPQPAALPPSVKKEPGDGGQQASSKYQDPGAQLSRRQAHIYHLLTTFKPGFLSSLLASGKSMRLPIMEAAQVVLVNSASRNPRFIGQGAPEQSFKMEKWLTGCI